MSDWDERIMAALIVGKRHRAFVRTNYETVLNVPKAQSKSVMEINNRESVKEEKEKKKTRISVSHVPLIPEQRCSGPIKPQQLRSKMVD